MNILVTGGAGFIGSHLVDKLLTEGHKVVVLDNSPQNITRNLKEHKNLTVVLEDVNNILKLRKAGDIHQIVHLAALADIVPSIEDPSAYHKANVDGTQAVLEFARIHGVSKFIYAASGSCYGDKPNVPTKETDPIDCKYPYALTKWMGEQYALHYNKVYKLPVISLRLFNVFGPRSRTTGTYGAVFGVFLAQKLANKPYTVVGSGSQSRDFIYVSDVVDLIVAALNSDRSGDVYNVGSGQHYSINSLCNLLGRNNGIDHLPDRPGEPKITLAWIAKAQEHFRFNVKVDFKKGVENMVRNIDYWKDAPVWDKATIAVATDKWFKTMGGKDAH